MYFCNYFLILLYIKHIVCLFDGIIYKNINNYIFINENVIHQATPRILLRKTDDDIIHNLVAPIRSKPVDKRWNARLRMFVTSLTDSIHGFVSQSTEMVHQQKVIKETELSRNKVNVDEPIVGMKMNKDGQLVVTKMKVSEKFRDREIKLYEYRDNNWYPGDDKRIPRLAEIEVNPDDPGIAGHFSVNDECFLTFDFEGAMKKGDVMHSRIYYTLGATCCDASNIFQFYVRPYDNQGILVYVDMYDEDSPGSDRCKDIQTEPFIRKERILLPEKCTYDPQLHSNQLNIVYDGATKLIRQVTIQLAKRPEDRWIKIPRKEEKECANDFEYAQKIRENKVLLDENIKLEDKKEEEMREKKRQEYIKENNDDTNEAEDEDEDEDEEEDEEEKIVEGKESSGIFGGITGNKMKKALEFIPGIVAERKKVKKVKKKKFKTVIEEKWHFHHCLGQGLMFLDDSQLANPILELNPNKQAMRLNGSSESAKRFHPLHKDEIEYLNKTSGTEIKGIDGKWRHNYNTTQVYYTILPDNCAFYKEDVESYHYTTDKIYNEDSLLLLVKLRQISEHNLNSIHWYITPQTFMEEWLSKEGNVEIRPTDGIFAESDPLSGDESLINIKTILDDYIGEDNKEAVPEYMAEVIEAAQRALENKKVEGTLPRIVHPNSVSLAPDCSIILNFENAIAEQRLENVIVQSNLQNIRLEGATDTSAINIIYYESKMDWKTNKLKIIKRIEKLEPLIFCMPYDPVTRKPAEYEVTLNSDDSVKQVMIQFFFKPPQADLPKVLYRDFIVPIATTLKAKKTNGQWFWQQCKATAVLDHLPDPRVSWVAPFILTSNPKNENAVTDELPNKCMFESGKSKYAVQELENGKYLVIVELSKRPLIGSTSKIILKRVDNLENVHTNNPNGEEADESGDVLVKPDEY